MQPDTTPQLVALDDAGTPALQAYRVPRRKDVDRPNHQPFDKVVLEHIHQSTSSQEEQEDHTYLAGLAKQVTRIVIQIEPRFKESSLSGSQWRVSSSIHAYYGKHEPKDAETKKIKAWCAGSTIRHGIVQLYIDATFRDDFLQGYDIDTEGVFKMTLSSFGHTLYDGYAHSMREAIAETFRLMHWNRPFEPDPTFQEYPRDDNLIETRCDQEGCYHVATERLHKRFDYCYHCGSKSWSGRPSTYYRRFCHEHSFRGTQGYDDSRDNYYTDAQLTKERQEEEDAKTGQ